MWWIFSWIKGKHMLRLWSEVFNVIGLKTIESQTNIYASKSCTIVNESIWKIYVGLSSKLETPVSTFSLGTTTKNVPINSISLLNQRLYFSDWYVHTNIMKNRATSVPKNLSPLTSLTYYSCSYCVSSPSDIINRNRFPSTWSRPLPHHLCTSSFPSSCYILWKG